MNAIFEDGQYAARIVRHELGMNNNGKPQLTLRLEVFGRYPHGNPELDLGKEYDEITPFQRTLWLTITADRREKGADGKMALVRGSWGWILETLRYLGWMGTDLEELDQDDPNGFKFDERTVVVECVNTVYNGVVRDKWNIVRPGRTVAGSQKPADRTKFFKDLKKKFKAEPVKAEPVEETVGAGAESVPF